MCSETFFQQHQAPILQEFILFFLCYWISFVYFLQNEPAFGRRLYEANAATKIDSIYLLKKNLLKAQASKRIYIYIYIYACMQSKMNILKTKSFNSKSHSKRLSECNASRIQHQIFKLKKFLNGRNCAFYYWSLKDKLRKLFNSSHRFCFVVDSPFW